MATLFRVVFFPVKFDDFGSKRLIVSEIAFEKRGKSVVAQAIGELIELLQFLWGLKNHLGFVFIDQTMARIIHEYRSCFSAGVVLSSFLLNLTDSVLNLMPGRVYQFVNFLEVQIAFLQEPLNG